LSQIITIKSRIKDGGNRSKQYAERLARAQRAHKKKRVTKLHSEIKNVRKEWSHHTANAILASAATIYIGDVSSSKLAKTRMAKSVLDAGWGQLRAILVYKAMRFGIVCKEVNEMFSSVTCSACLLRSGPRGLSGLGVRGWCCSSCGAKHDRDVNAALNILRTGHGTPIKGSPGLKAGEDVREGTGRCN
jgi:IS605 OrfB family transposase